jgi:ABC-type branched-subunit amino acid transport system ATPase component
LNCFGPGPTGAGSTTLSNMITKSPRNFRQNSGNENEEI